MQFKKNINRITHFRYLVAYKLKIFSTFAKLIILYNWYYEHYNYRFSRKNILLILLEIIIISFLKIIEIIFFFIKSEVLTIFWVSNLKLNSKLYFFLLNNFKMKSI